MGTYEIAGIAIRFDYCFHEYLDERIEKYRMAELPVSYHLMTQVVKELSIPKGNIILHYQNRILFESSDQEILCIFNQDGLLIIKVSYKKDYTQIQIEMNALIGDKLPEIEYYLSGIYFFSIAFENGYVPIHASAIAYQNEAILFSAPSGTGKSTHAKLWQSFFEGVHIINDDKPLIALKDHRFHIIGTPWSGKTNQNENWTLPLKAICFLEQGKVNHVIEMTSQDKMTYLLRNMYRPKELEPQNILFNQIETMIETIPMVVFQCDISKQAVMTLHHYLYSEGKNEN